MRFVARPASGEAKIMRIDRFTYLCPFVYEIATKSKPPTRTGER
jgi:hypothetical protein